MLGSKRYKATRLLTNMEHMKAMGVKCNHRDDQHEPYGYDKEKKKFATSEEAEYPPMFCQKMAECVHKQLNAKAFLVKEAEWTRYDSRVDEYVKPPGNGPSLEMITKRVTEAYDRRQKA